MTAPAQAIHPYDPSRVQPRHTDADLGRDHTHRPARPDKLDSGAYDLGIPGSPF
jgi:hypothetical protein